MSARFAHTCLRVTDPEASVRFYTALGYEPRGRLELPGAHNLYLGLPGGADTLELTVNDDRPARYELGTSFGHVALAVDDLEGALARLRAACGAEPERAPYRPGGRGDHPRIAFVADPDGHRIELIDGPAYATPRDEDGGAAA